MDRIVSWGRNLRLTCWANLPLVGKTGAMKISQSNRFLQDKTDARTGFREAEKANIPFLAELPRALRRCSSLMWLVTLRSERLALHPASAPKNGLLAISASLTVSARTASAIEGIR